MPTPAQDVAKAGGKLVVVALAAGLMLGQIALMAVPAVSVELASRWSLNAAEIGWLGGIYFAGYALGLPFLSAATSRFDGRKVYAVSALIAALASFAFASAANGFWAALALRFCAGVGFSGIHIVGMKLMADRLAGPAQARAGAFYSAAYAIGSGTSFLIAGGMAKLAGWPAAFYAASAGSLLAAPLVMLLRAQPSGAQARTSRWFPDFRPLLREPETLRYVVAYAGNTWEVFSMRVWFVPLLAFNASHHGVGVSILDPSTLAGISAIAAVPVSLAVAEASIRIGRERMILLVAIASVAVSLVLGWVAAGPYLIVVALLFLHGATSYGDAGAINGGMVAASHPETRAAALTLFGVGGFVSGFIGSFAVGGAINAAGGMADANAWLAGCAVIGAGSMLTALIVSPYGQRLLDRLASGDGKPG